MSYTPMTPLEAEELIRKVAGRLVRAIDEHGDRLRDLAEAKSTYNEALLKAQLHSFAEWGKKRTVGEHAAHAEMQAVEEYRALQFAEAAVRSLKEEMHSLRQVLSSLQTNARAMQGVA